MMTTVMTHSASLEAGETIFTLSFREAPARCMDCPQIQTDLYPIQMIVEDKQTMIIFMILSVASSFASIFRDWDEI